MNNKQKIILDCGDNYNYNYYTFTLKGEFILREVKDNFIFIYSTQTKNNKLNCKRIYKIPEGFNFISISKYDKLYLCSNNSIYEHNLITQKSIRIFKSDKIELISYELKFYISYDKVIKYNKLIVQSHLKIFCN
jgi:predicted transcriptional regulator